MTKTLDVEVAQATLKEIIAELKPDEEVVIVQNHQPMARIVAPRKPKPRFGGCKGMLTIVEDDDEHLEDFKEYVP